MDNSEINLEEYNKKSIEYWEGFFCGVTTNEIKYDDWLERFQNEINNCKTPIIDLGCGIGNDTKYLIEKGKEVIPCDFSPIAIQNINKNFPEIKRTEVFDMTEGLPFEDNYTELIIADLSIHYFIEKVTFFILEEIKRVLKPNGILLFRVNSINDTNYGAGSGREIEHHLYEVSIQNGSLKRFFDKEDIDKFFDGWKILYLNEDILRRFLPEKKLWTGAVQVIKKLKIRRIVMDNKEYLGKIINIKIDRPLGSGHPEYPTSIYPINYGYVPGTISGDGKELDCFLLGVFKAVDEYTGKCIAIIHRTNDNDDKLIIVPEGKDYSNDAIEALVEFQEQYFEHIIIR